MKLNSRAFAVLAILAVAGAVLLAGSDEALASNMGFKENKQIFPKDGPPSNGKNLVALPFHGPYNNSQDICDALNLGAPGSGTTCRVSQINAGTGAPVGPDFCNAAGGSFVLLAKVSVIVEECATATSGIIVGSHAPGGTVSVFPQDGPPSNGVNHYPIPFHTTNANMQQVCTDLGLVAPVRISSINADTGALRGPWFCGGGGAPPALVLGEGLIIEQLPPGPTPTPVPSHF